MDVRNAVRLAGRLACVGALMILIVPVLMLVRHCFVAVRVGVAVVMHPYSLDLDAHALLLRVLGLLREVKLERYQALLYSLHDVLEELEEEFGNEATGKIFKATEIRIDVGRRVKDDSFGFVARNYHDLSSIKGGKITESRRSPELGMRDFMLDFRELRRASNYDPSSPRKQYEEFDAQQKAETSTKPEQKALRSQRRSRVA